MGDAGVDGIVSVQQARLLLQQGDTIEQVADVASDVTNRRALLCKGEERASLHFLVRVRYP